MSKERIEYIADFLARTKTAWPLVVAEIDVKVDELTVQLINNDNEQTRGRIKALIGIKELPETLLQELEGMRAALSDEDAAD
jgi:hypothetical protein